MSRGAVKVRTARQSDVADVVELIRGADPAATASARASSQPELCRRVGVVVDDPSCTVLVAFEEPGAAVIGIAVVGADEQGAVDLTPVLHVSHLVVAREHRRRGVARSLLAAVVQLADERGIERVMATAAAGSRESNRYLARLGFGPLVIDRIASTKVLRRTLGLSDATERSAVLRRARLIRAQRAGRAVAERS